MAERSGGAQVAPGRCRRAAQAVEGLDQLVEPAHAAPVEVEAQAGPQQPLLIAGLAGHDHPLVHQVVEVAVELAQVGVGHGHVELQFHPVAVQFGRMEHPVEAAHIGHGGLGAAGLEHQGAVLR
ncbi:MAG: hypothetical protein ACKOZN_06690 [Cyanobium sp.]